MISIRTCLIFVETCVVRWYELGDSSRRQRPLHPGSVQSDGHVQLRRGRRGHQIFRRRPAYRQLRLLRPPPALRRVLVHAGQLHLGPRQPELALDQQQPGHEHGPAEQAQQRRHNGDGEGARTETVPGRHQEAPRRDQHAHEAELRAGVAAAAQSRGRQLERLARRNRNRDRLGPAEGAGENGADPATGEGRVPEGQAGPAGETEAAGEGDQGRAGAKETGDGRVHGSGRQTVRAATAEAEAVEAGA